jgi:hypothetical protein
MRPFDYVSVKQLKKRLEDLNLIPLNTSSRCRCGAYCYPVNNVFDCPSCGYSFTTGKEIELLKNDIDDKIKKERC